MKAEDAVPWMDGPSSALVADIAMKRNKHQGADGNPSLAAHRLDPVMYESVLRKGEVNAEGHELLPDMPSFLP